MIPFLTSPAPCRPPPVLPLPLPPSSSFCNAGALLSFVWQLILAKRTDQIFLLQCMRLSAGASQIWWLGLTDGRGPRVLKSVTDSGGFDSPRASRTGSPKTPGEKRGEEEEGGVKERRAQKRARASGEQKHLWSGQGWRQRQQQPSEAFWSLHTALPSISFPLSPLPLLPSPKAFCLPCPWMPRSCFLMSFPLFLTLWWYPGSINEMVRLKQTAVQFVYSTSIPWRFPKPMSSQSLTIINLV